MSSYIIKIYLTSLAPIILNSFFNKLNSLFKLNSFLFRISKNKLTLLKSPHVHKKARIQYQHKYYKKLIIFETKNFFILLYFLKNLQKLNVKKINYKIKLIK